MSESSDSTIRAWRYVTGLDITDVRVVPIEVDEPTTYIDGCPVQSNARIELQVDGEWSGGNGVYTVNDDGARLAITEQ